MNNLAWFLIDNDINLEEGVDLADNALTKLPGNWALLDTKGWGLYKQGHYEEALNLLKESWDINPSYNHASYLNMQEVEKTVAGLN